MTIIFRHQTTGHELAWTVANSGVSSRDLLAMNYEIDHYVPRVVKSVGRPVRDSRREWAETMNATAFLPEGIAPF